MQHHDQPLGLAPPDRPTSKLGQRIHDALAVVGTILALTFFVLYVLYCAAVAVVLGGVICIATYKSIQNIAIRAGYEATRFELIVWSGQFLWAVAVLLGVLWCGIQLWLMRTKGTP